MPGNYLSYPFDEELFSYLWANEPDLTLTALLDSGAMVDNAEIRKLIANGSGSYTLPFYKTLGGEPENYDGKTDITLTDPDAGFQKGVVYGRAHGWKAKDFIIDFNSGADPMRQIVSQVSRYWQKQRQKTLLGIIKATFQCAGGEGWQAHSLDISASSGTATPENKIGPATVAEAIQQAVGDAGNQFSLAVMHSKVAVNLAALNLLQFRKYTDPAGVERQLGIADINGMTVVVDDSVPSFPSTNPQYVTYLFGRGALHYAPAPVEHPVSTFRNELTGGGFTGIVTRLRETIHPNGFSYNMLASVGASPKQTDLEDWNLWSLAANPKGIAMARIISNG